MSAIRVWPDQTQHPADLTGPQLAALQSAEGNALWNGVISQVTSVGGSANAITGVCTPPLTATPAHGQTFRLTPGADCSGAVTINLDSRGAISLKDQDANASATGDVLNTRPIMFWYDSNIPAYRLVGPSQAETIAAVAATITSSQLWEELGDTTIGAAVASVEHTFTAGNYSRLLVAVSGLSPSSAGVQLVATLRNASGAIITLTTAGYAAGAGTMSAADLTTAEVTFLIDLISATKYHVGRLWGGGLDAFNSNQVLTTVADVVGNSATAPDRIRIAYNSGNIDAGRIITKALKA